MSGSTSRPGSRTRFDIIDCGWKGCDQMFADLLDMNIHVQLHHMQFKVDITTTEVTKSARYLEHSPVCALEEVMNDVGGDENNRNNGNNRHNNTNTNTDVGVKKEKKETKNEPKKRTGRPPKKQKVSNEAEVRNWSPPTVRVNARIGRPKRQLVQAPPPPRTRTIPAPPTQSPPPKRRQIRTFEDIPVLTAENRQALARAREMEMRNVKQEVVEEEEEEAVVNVEPPTVINPQQPVVVKQEEEQPTTSKKGPGRPKLIVVEPVKRGRGRPPKKRKNIGERKVIVPTRRVSTYRRLYKTRPSTRMHNRMISTTSTASSINDNSE